MVIYGARRAIFANEKPGHVCQNDQCWHRYYELSIDESSNSTDAQQSVHLTLGILRESQAVFYALAFFQLDGFAVPAPAQVTQTVGHLTI